MPSFTAASIRTGLVPAALCLALALLGCSDDEPSAERSGTERTAPARGQPLEVRVGRGTVAVTARVGGDVVRSSGVVIDADQGLVLTSAHSVWGARSLKLRTSLGTTHGRLVARSACEDLALIEAQPRLPGLTAIPLRASGATSGEELRLVAWRRQADGAYRLISRAAGVTERTEDAVLHPRLPTLPVALRHEVPLHPESTGGALVDAEGRLVGLAQVALPPGAAAINGLAVPVEQIRELLGELRPGPSTTFVGWESQYRCAPRLNDFAGATHEGFRPQHARLNAPLPATRVPGVEGVDG